MCLNFVIIVNHFLLYKEVQKTFFCFIMAKLNNSGEETMTKGTLIDLRKELFSVENKLFEGGLKNIMEAFRELPLSLKDVVMLNSSIGKAVRAFDEDEMTRVVWFNFALDGVHNHYSKFDVESLNDDLSGDKKLTPGQVKKAKLVQEKINLVVAELESIPFTGVNNFKAEVNSRKVIIRIV